VRGRSHTRGHQRWPSAHSKLRCRTLDKEQGNGGAVMVRQVVLTKLHEGLVGNPLQRVIEVVTLSRGEPSRHAQVGGVSQDVHVDLVA
jgi:hypothetical protein